MISQTGQGLLTWGPKPQRPLLTVNGKSLTGVLLFAHMPPSSCLQHFLSFSAHQTCYVSMSMLSFRKGKFGSLDVEVATGRLGKAQA